MMSSVLKELNDAVAEGRLVSLVRRGELEELTGIPLAVGSRLVLIRLVNCETLLPDGWVVLRVQDLTELRTTEWDRIVQRALIAESLLPDPAGTPAVRLDGWAGALEDLYARGELVSLECEDEENGFAVGVLTALGQDCVTIRHAAADGVWEEDDWTVYHEGITRVPLAGATSGCS